MGAGVLSRDGSLLALVHDLWYPGEPQAAIIDVTDTPRVVSLISDGTTKNFQKLAFSPDGSRLAVSLSEQPTVRVYRVADGALLNSVDVPNQRAVAWLNDVTLLIGGKTLTAWSLPEI